MFWTRIITAGAGLVVIIATCVEWAMGALDQSQALVIITVQVGLLVGASRPASTPPKDTPQ